MVTERTINIDVTVTIECCRDGVEAYTPAPQDFHKIHTETKDEFDESLTRWRDRIIDRYEDYLRGRAEDECKIVGTRDLCLFDADWSNTTVDERIIGVTIPSEVMGNIEVILRKINENRDDVDYVQELIKELDRILSRYGLTREDIRDLIEREGLGDILL